MAIKDHKETTEAPEANTMDAGAPLRKRPIVLTAEESENLLRMLSEPPAPLSAEVKRAIANYKRIKAERAR